MAASDHLNQVQFDFAPANEDYPRHRILADASKGKGEFSWHPETGEITNVWVDEGVLGQGVATGMYHRAQEIAREHGLAVPVHSAYRSPAGDAWARSTGDSVPPLDEKSRTTKWLDPRQQVRP